MERLIARLERRFGRYAIENLTLYVVGGMGIAYVLTLINPAFESALVFSKPAVLRGEVWRCISFALLPPASSPLFVAFLLSAYYTIGASIEAQWGAFRLNLYYALGWLMTLAGAWTVGFGVGNGYLNASVLFAFATLFPEFEVLLMFVLPVKMKWLAWILAAFEAYAFFSGDIATKISIGAPLVSYALFFAGEIRSRLQARRPRSIETDPESRRPSFRPPSAQGLGNRSCAICGALEVDGADIRVCSCDVCGNAPRTLCLEHARNHRSP